MTLPCSHAILRARERLGCDLTDADLKLMEDAIRAGDARCIDAQADGTAFWDTWTPDGVPCRLLLDAGTGTIITVLTAGSPTTMRYRGSTARLSATIAEILRAKEERCL